jgi:hypothetical protein
VKQSQLKHVLYFYELTEISEILDQIILHFGDIKQVHWLSSNAFLIMKLLLVI